MRSEDRHARLRRWSDDIEQQRKLRLESIQIKRGWDEEPDLEQTPESVTFGGPSSDWRKPPLVMFSAINLLIGLSFYLSLFGLVLFALWLLGVI